MLRFVNARNDKKKLNEIKKLYDEAFPKEEQIPFWILRKASRMEAKSCRHYAAGFRHAGSF